MTLPSPPAVLPPRPRLHELRPGDPLVRFYNPAHGSWDCQRTYGPLPEVRFDPHEPPLGRSAGRSAWYAAATLVGAVAESFGNLGFLDKGAGRRVCVVRARAPIPLLDLVGVAPRVFGLDQEIGTSRDYDRCQEWARAFYESYPHLHGIRWRGRQAGSICYVLSDRADMTALELLADRDIAQPEVWPRIARAARACNLRILAP